MKHPLPLCALFIAVSLMSTRAQQKTPRAAFLYPAGGRAGTALNVIVCGQFLDGAQEVYVSGKGIQATVGQVIGPLSRAETDALREELQELQQKHTKAVMSQTNAVVLAVRNNQARAETPQVISQAKSASPSPGETHRIKELQRLLDESTRKILAPPFSWAVTLHMVLAPDASVGAHELRLMTSRGLTNPITFYVDTLPEYSRPLRYVPSQLAADGGIALSEQVHAEIETDPVAVSPPLVVNGQMMPGSLDRYRFHAMKGQHLVIEAKTRALIPYLSDAVPGWFQATLSLYGPKGEELISTDHFRFWQDPVLEQDVPEEGDYTVAIRDVIYRGREDFVYRISIGELPYVTAIFPLGAIVGSHASIELSGWNLPVKTYHPETEATGVQVLAKGKADWKANPMPFDVESLPEVAQTNAVFCLKQARRVSLPVIVNGRISHPGEKALFRIDADAGEEIVAEVYARRLGSPLDSMLRLLDSQGRELASNDDAIDKGAALLTHQADSKLSYQAPAKGSYYLQITDAQRNGGMEYSYRLRLSHPRPDYELRVVPSAISVHPGETTIATVYALRKDGFSGPVVLHLKEAPPGLTLAGGTIPAGMDSVRVTYTAPSLPSSSPQKLELEGEAQIDGQVVRHVGVPADDRMQAFAWHHLVPSQEGLIAVLGSRRSSIWQLQNPMVTLFSGGSTVFHIGVPASYLANDWEVKLNDPPPGINIAEVTKAQGGLAIRLQATDKTTSGLRGNLIMEASMRKPINSSNTKTSTQTVLGTLPAVSFEVLPKQAGIAK